jgi:hypothetical protein
MDVSDKQLVLEVLFKNLEKKTFIYPLTYPKGIIVYSLLDEEYFATSGLLAYKAEIIDQNDRVLKEWTHRFWIDIITVEDE